MNRIEPGLKQTSVASTISFVFGVGALLTLVLVRPSMILSVPAILFGHIAKQNLKNSNGDLVGWGKARIGKLLGYFCLVVSTLMFFYLSDYRLMVRGAMESERTAVVNRLDKFSPGQLGEIEQKLAAGETNEFGNNEVAEFLAADFRRKLRESLNSVLTHRDEKGIGLDTSGICCYCHISEGVSFIAAIPELNGYNGAAEKVLKKAAWQSALLAVQVKEIEGFNTGENIGIAVGLMQNSECETVMVGTQNSQLGGVPAPDSIENDGSVLASLVNE